MVLRIRENLFPVVKASIAVGAAGVFVGKCLVDAKFTFGVLLPHLVPPEVSCITLFFISFLPGFALISQFYAFEDGERKFLSKRGIFLCILPLSIARNLALAANIPIVNMIFLSCLAIGITYTVTQPVLHSAINFATYRLPRMLRA